ncbi:MAG: hypothetical protein KatS3mg079_582 [Caloramator sp.]|nr:MAG: hypothetical protein KatS3mg079_582 [Caloramator sp.]
MDEMLLHQLIEEVKLLREEIRLLNLKIDGGSNLKKNLIKIEKLNHIGVSETQNDTIELNNQNAAINYIMSRKMMIKNYKTDVDDDIFMKLSNYLGIDTNILGNYMLS